MEPVELFQLFSRKLKNISGRRRGSHPLGISHSTWAIMENVAKSRRVRWRLCTKVLTGAFRELRAARGAERAQAAEEPGILHRRGYWMLPKKRRKPPVGRAPAKVCRPSRHRFERHELRPVFPTKFRIIASWRRIRTTEKRLNS